MQGGGGLSALLAGLCESCGARDRSDRRCDSLGPCGRDAGQSWLKLRVAGRRGCGESLQNGGRCADSLWQWREGGRGDIVLDVCACARLVWNNGADSMDSGGDRGGWLCASEVWEAMVWQATSIELSGRGLDCNSDIDLGGGWDAAWEFKGRNNSVWLSIAIGLALTTSWLSVITGSWLSIIGWLSIRLAIAAGSTSGLSINVAWTICGRSGLL